MGQDEKPSSASLELVFSVLRKHEEALDKVARRLEDIADAMSMMKRREGGPSVRREGLVIEGVDDWKEFKEKGALAYQVLYEIGTAFTVKALLSDGRLLKYIEPFVKPDTSLYKVEEPREEGKDSGERTLKLKCGLGYSLRRTGSKSSDDEHVEGILIAVDAQKAKEWLGGQLDVDEVKIFSGTVVI